MAKRIGAGTLDGVLPTRSPAEPAAPTGPDTRAWEATPAVRALLARIALLLERNEPGLSFAALREALGVETDTLHSVLNEGIRGGAFRRVGARTATLYLLNPRDTAGERP